MVLDAKQLLCPLPLIRTKKAIDSIVEGQLLMVLATDRGSEADIPVFVERLGHELVHAREENGVFEFLIRKR